MKVELKWKNSINETIKKVIPIKNTAMFMAMTWHKLYTPWIPFGDSGELASNVTYLNESLDIVPIGVIRHNVPYAHRQYEGVNHKFRNRPHPLATHHWDKAAIEAGKYEAFKRSVERYIKGGG